MASMLTLRFFAYGQDLGTVGSSRTAERVPAPSSSAAQTVRSPARAYFPRRISWETTFRSQPNRPFSVFGDWAAGRKLLVPEGNDKPSAENRSTFGMMLTSGRTLTWDFYMSSDERLIYEIMRYMAKSRTLMRSMY